jgi:hypothetical protein
MEVVDYSKYSIAVFGDSKAIKEQLKNLECKWNENLTDPITKEKRKSYKRFG